LSSAEIDEVVLGSEGKLLASSGIRSAGILGTCIEDTIIERQRRLGITTSSIVIGVVVGRRVIIGVVIGRRIIVIVRRIVICWGSLRPFEVVTLVPLSSEGLTRKERNDNNKSCENSGKLHCVGCMKTKGKGFTEVG